MISGSLRRVRRLESFLIVLNGLLQIVEFSVHPPQGIEEATFEKFVAKPFALPKGFLERDNGLLILPLAATSEPSVPDVLE